MKKITLIIFLIVFSAFSNLLKAQVNGQAIDPISSTPEDPIYFYIESASDGTVTYGGAQYTGDFRGNVREERGKHGGARHQRGGHIDRVGKEEDERAHELQRAGIDREAVRQVLRERDGIVRRLGEGAQPLGAQDPVGRRTDGKADADPHLAEAEGEDRAGQAHQQPRGHIGRLRGQGGDPGAHGAPAEEEVLRIFVRAVEVEHQRHAEQDNKVRDKCCDLPVHKLLSFRLSV